MIRVKSDIAGRLRFSIPSIRKGRSLEEVQSLGAVDGIRWLRRNDKCASLVVRYDGGVIGRDDVVAEVHRLFGPRLAEDPYTHTCVENPSCGCGSACGCSSATCGCGHDGQGVKNALQRFVGISAVGGVALVRSTLMGATLAQTAFSPLGIAALVFSWPLVRDGVQCLKRKKLNLEGFLGAGIVTAVAAGEALTAFEILWINSGAELLTAWITERSRRSIAEILEITSHHTFVLVDGVEVERAVQDVRTGDVVVLHTGEKIAVDGVIVRGEGLINEAPITGREELVHKQADDTVFAGTFVREGVVYVRAEQVGDTTYLARIMRKVEDSLETRAPIEGVADRLAATLVKVGFAATAVTFIVTGSAWRAFTVLLVMACPCATTLAASTAVSAAMNAAARNHILIKGGRYLEEIGSCDTVCFDKTGTLTTTEPSLVVAAPVDAVEEDELLRLAVSAEVHNHHPLASAIKEAALERDIAPMPHAVCDYRLGMGMRAAIGDDEILVGNAKLAHEYGATIGELERRATSARTQGLTVLYVFRNRKPLGVLAFESRERPGAERVVQRLRDMGVDHVMLITGDEEATARDLARRLDIGECHHSVLPGEKAEIVERTMAQGRKVVMVGDGINDALALARADVGVAVGTGGSEVAVEAADIALVADDMEGLADIYGLSRKTIRVVNQNFWIATGSNVAGVVLGAAGILSPVMAGVIHIAHSLGVLANSSRLLAGPDTPDSDSRPAISATHSREKHGLQYDSATQTVSRSQAPRAGQDQDQVQHGDSFGQDGIATGQGQ